MAKPLGNYKYQINIFSGSQSYILRTNAIKEVKDFTGKKKINSSNIVEYLNQLNADVFGIENAGAYEVKNKDKKGGKKKTKAQPQLFSEIQQPDYIVQVRTKLSKLGAKTEKQALALLKKKTGITAKCFGKIKMKDAQMAMIKLLGGK